MDYKLIVSDYDMTLTTTKRTITKRTIDAIKNFQDNGGSFAICTSRPLYAVNSLIKGVDSRIIISNQGADIFDFKTNSYIYNCPLKKDEVAELLSYFKKLAKHIFLMNDKQSVCENFSLAEYLCNKIVKYDLKPIYEEFDNYYPTSVGISQIIIFDKSRKKIDKMCADAQKVFAGKYEIGKCDKNMINITSKGVSKGASIKEILSYLNLTSNEAIAFGDSQNDESMFESVKIGVAMGNSMEELKQKATVVCDTCDNDGLAKFIEENVLK